MNIYFYWSPPWCASLVMAVTQEFGKKSARVRVEGLKGQNPTFFVGELCKEIDPDKSYVKVKSDMVRVVAVFIFQA